MTIYKLIYFDLRALAEPIRWIFKYAKIPFEDERIPIENWSQLASDPITFPLGQVPVLQMDGQNLTQSMPIARFLCSKFGFVAADPFSNYRSDQVAHIVEDARLLIRPMVIEPDPQKKEVMKRNIISHTLPPHLNQISSIVNDLGNNFIVGNEITYGDFILANWLDIWEQILDQNLLNNYPLLKKQKNNVMNLKEIKAWVDMRPQTMI